jgi:hypothetical protein
MTARLAFNALVTEVAPLCCESSSALQLTGGLGSLDTLRFVLLDRKGLQ